MAGREHLEFEDHKKEYQDLADEEYTVVQYTSKWRHGDANPRFGYVLRRGGKLYAQDGMPTHDAANEAAATLMIDLALLEAGYQVEVTH